MARRWGAVGLVIRARLRHGLWGMLALAVVIAVAGGAVLAAVAGARRTESAYARLQTETGAVDVTAGTFGFRDEAEEQRFGRVATRLAQVEEGDTLLGFGTTRRGSDGEPLVEEDAPALIAPMRGHLFYEIGQLVLDEGRLPRPNRVDEAAMNRIAADVMGLEIGSRVSLFVLDLARAIEIFERAQAEGREPDPQELAPLMRPVEFRIVGIGTDATEIVGGENVGEDAALIVSPAFAARHGDIIGFSRVYANLHDPDRDLAAFQNALRREFPGAGVSFTTATTNLELFERSVEPYVRALQLFALALGLVAVFIVGQAVIRQIAADVEDAPRLRALGVGSAELVTTTAARGVMAGVVGAVLAVVVALAASPLFPLGLARTAEPNSGMSADWAVLAPGAASVGVAIAVIAVVAALLQVRVAKRPRVARHRSPSSIAERLARAGAAPSAVLGVSGALGRDDRAWRSPVGSILTGLVVSVTAIVAALGFGASLQHLVASPPLYGWTWDVMLDAFDVSAEPVTAKVDDDPAVSGWALGARGAVSLDGRVGPAIGFEPGKGDVGPAITEGRAPADDDEVALGAHTLRALHVTVGDTVLARTVDGERTSMVRVVGRSVLPAVNLDEIVGMAEGATFTLGGLHRFDPGAVPSFIVVGFERPEALRSIRARYDRTVGVLGPQRPREILSFDAVRTTPAVLAAMLAALGVGVLAHGLVSMVHRGRRELAILKTLGFTSGQISAMVAANATALAFVGALVGVPLGIAFGRWSWRLFADPYGLDAPSVVPIGAVVLIAASVLVLANVVAAIPARQAARTPAAIVLRAE